WEKRLADIEQGGGDRSAFMRDIAGFTADTVAWFADKDRSVMRAHRRVIGPCPNGDGEIVERPLSYSCTSWKSKAEPGCGYQIWKSQRGRGEVTREMAEQMLREGNFEAPAAAARGAREPLGPCPTPNCGGTVVSNRAGWGCDSWKSKKSPGCGYAIWR